MKKNKEISEYVLGYNNLKKKKTLDKISQIQEKLSKKCNFVNDNYANEFFFIKKKNFNSIFVNIFLSKFGISKLRNVLIAYNSSSTKKISYAMPEGWIKIFLAEGYRVNIFISKFKFLNLILKHLIIGIYSIIKINIFILINFFNNDLINFSYFNNCSIYNFPRDGYSSKYNLFNFCKLNLLKANIVNFLYSNNTGIKKISILKNLNSISITIPLKSN